MRRLLWRRGDDGTTLTELNITMIVLSVILVATTSLIIGFQRSNAENMSRQEQIDSARYAAERMSRSIRAAVKPAQITTSCTGATCQDIVFMLGEDYHVKFYANLDNEGGKTGPSRVEYVIEDGSLREIVQVPDSPTPSASGFQYCDYKAASASQACKDRVATRLLAEGVRTDLGVPLFTYWTHDGHRLDPAAYGGTLTGEQMQTVVAVEVHINVQAPNATRAAPTEYVQRIMLPNVQAIIRQEEEATTP